MNEPGFAYLFGIENSTATKGAYESAKNNPDVSWEKAFKQDYGFDMNFFDDRLRTVFDYYREHRTNILAQDCSLNPELAELKTFQTSTAMRKMGGVLALSPMVDVCRIPSFNRLEESYGEDGYLSAAMGVAFVKGLQQGDLKKGVGACSKHYLGYGGGGDAEEKEMMEEILLPHEAMIRLAGSKCVMPGYHAVHGTKCVANSEILQDILRDYVGFDGMVVSDYTAIDQLPDLEDVVQKAAAAINGGNDVDFPFGANYQHLQKD